MTCQVINNSGIDLTSLEPHVQGMYDYFDQKIGFQKPPVMVFDSDPSNQSKVLGKTAYYDPMSLEIHIFTDGRHPKDMLRSIAHELIHHQQNEEGRLNVGGYMGEGYYLKNEAMRELEQEAMLEGNALMREYEDKRKLEEKSKMSLKEWKNNELNKNLLKKFGILKESNNLTEKEVPTYSKKEAEERYDKITHDGPADFSIGHMGKKTEMFKMKEEMEESSCGTHRKKNEQMNPQYQNLAKERIAKIEKKEGRKLTPEEKQAIMDDFARQGRKMEEGDLQEMDRRDEIYSMISGLMPDASEEEVQAAVDDYMRQARGRAKGKRMARSNLRANFLKQKNQDLKETINRLTRAKKITINGKRIK